MNETLLQRYSAFWRRYRALLQKCGPISNFLSRVQLERGYTMSVCLYLCVCMHVCMYAWMRACMYVCVHVCIHVCVYVCMYVCMYVCTNVCLYVCMFTARLVQLLNWVFAMQERKKENDCMFARI